MQTVRLNLEIKAPVERCYRLSLSPELARDAMDGWRSEREAEEVRTLREGDVLRWGAQRRIRTMSAFAETITAVRSRTFVRRSYAGNDLVWAEGSQYFAPLNDGTWVREELKFATRPGVWRPLRDRRVRKAIERMMTARGQFLKAVAEGAGWAHYLGTDGSSEQRRA